MRQKVQRLNTAIFAHKKLGARLTPTWTATVAHFTLTLSFA